MTCCFRRCFHHYVDKLYAEYLTGQKCPCKCHLVTFQTLFDSSRNVYLHCIYVGGEKKGLMEIAPRCWPALKEDCEKKLRAFLEITE